MRRLWIFMIRNLNGALLSPANGIDTNNDEELQVLEAEAVDRIAASDYGIVSVDGIECFISITKL